MEKNIRKYLFDILDCIQSIEAHFGGDKSTKTLESNRTVRAAIEREFSIIAEATSRILKIEPDFPITNARQIIGMRNRIIHAYELTDTDIL